MKKHNLQPNDAVFVHVLQALPIRGTAPTQCTAGQCTFLVLLLFDFFSFQPLCLVGRVLIICFCFVSRLCRRPKPSGTISSATPHHCLSKWLHSRSRCVHKNRFAATPVLAPALLLCSVLFVCFVSHFVPCRLQPSRQMRQYIVVIATGPDPTQSFRFRRFW